MSKQPPEQPPLFDVRPPLSELEREGLRKDARKLAGEKPARTDRDPARIKRKRKALTR